MTQDLPAQIKSQIRLSEIAGNYTQLKRSGNKWKGQCPLPDHTDKSPSFQVDDSRGRFHCFGCGAKGDHFELVQKLEALDFKGALKRLSETTGIPIPTNRKINQTLNKGLQAVNDAAVNFYQRQLKLNPEAQNYLSSRGLSHQTIDLFKIGATTSAQWDSLYKVLRKDFPDDLLDRSGLFKKGKYGRYDLFRDRVIFPIRDGRGQTIGFGGRILPSVFEKTGNEIPKYLNSPETSLFKKSTHLYNLDFAKHFFPKNKQAIVVEGYIDVISLYQAGITNTVAPLGTAFSTTQAEMLRKYVDSAVLNFDADAAGQKAAQSSLPSLLATDLDVQVLKLPKNMDPDDFIKALGSTAYLEKVKQAPDFYKYLIEQHLQEGYSNNPRAKSAFANKILGTLSHVSDALIKEHYLGLLASDLAVPTEIIREQLAAISPGDKKQENPNPKSMTLKSKTPSIKQAPKGLKIMTLRQDFLYHIMTRPELMRKLTNTQARLLRSIVSHHYGETLNQFIFASPETSLKARIGLAPAAYREKLHSISRVKKQVCFESFEVNIMQLAKEKALDGLQRDNLKAAKKKSPARLFREKGLRLNRD